MLLNPPHRRNVVIVDDELGMRRLLRSVLEPRGYAVIECASGEDFLQFLAAHRTDPPSCVLLDLHLLGMDGRDVRARMGRVSYPVVLMTGDSKGAEQAGGEFDAVLKKPIDWQQLCSVLDKLHGPPVRLGL